MAHDILTAPLTLAQIRERADEDGYITVVVGVDLEVIVQADLDSYYDLLSVLVTGSLVLQDITDRPVGADPATDVVYIEVTGMVSSARKDTNED